MDNYEKLIGDIGDCLIAHPSEKLCKRILREAANAIEQLVKERDAIMTDFLNGYKDQVERGHGIFRCDICKHGIDNAKETSCRKGNCNGFSKWEWRGVRSETDVR